jgi:hypothetical protein
MPQTNCRPEIEKVLGRSLTDREFGAIGRQGERLKARLNAAGGDPVKMKVALQQFVEKQEEIKQARQTIAAGNELARVKQNARIAQTGDFALKAPGQVLQSMAIESLKQFPGANDSLGVRITHGTAERQQAMIADLQKAKLDDYAFSGTDDKNIRFAFGALQRADGTEAQYGPKAVAVAKILKSHSDMLWNDKKAAFIPVGKQEDWEGPQQHDPFSLARAGGNNYGSPEATKAWVNDLMTPKNKMMIDWNKSFGGELANATDADKRQRLAEIHKQFVAHNHLQYGASDPTKSRELFFASPEDGWNYHQKYGGNRSFAEDMASHLKYGARDVEIAKEWGPGDLKSAFTRVIEPWEKQIAEQGSAKALADFTNTKKALFDKWLPSLTNSLSSPEHAAVHYVQALRTAMDTISIAGSLVVLPGDIPLAMRAMEEHGGASMQGYFKSMGKTMDRFAGLNKDERFRLATEMGILLNDATKPLTHSSMEWEGFGAVNKASQYANKYFGHSGWSDRTRLNVGTAFGVDHWIDRGKTFSQLLPGQQRYMQTFGIGDKEWDVIRQQTPVQIDSKTSTFSPLAIRRMDLNEFKPLAGATASDAALRRARTDLADRYRNMMAELAERHTTGYSASMQAITNQGTNAGSGIGQVLRSANELKGFTYNLMRKHLGAMVMGDANPDNVGWGRAMMNFAKGSGGVPGARVKFLKFAANNVAFGMLVNAMSDVRDGKEPETVMDPAQTKDVLLRAFMRQSFGLYSDFLLSQVKNPDAKLWDTIGNVALGPTAGKVLDIGDVISRVLGHTGEYATGGIDNDTLMKRLGGDTEQAARVGYGVVPGNNFIWTKWATDRYIKDNLLDAINPGYKERLYNRMQKTDQTYIGGNPQ